MKPQILTYLDQQLLGCPGTSRVARQPGDSVRWDPVGTPGTGDARMERRSQPHPALALAVGAAQPGRCRQLALGGAGRWLEAITVGWW